MRSGDMSGTLVQKGCVTRNKASLIRLPCSRVSRTSSQCAERPLRFCLVTVGSRGQRGGSTGLRTGSTCSNSGLVVYVPQASRTRRHLACGLDRGDHSLFTYASSLRAIVLVQCLFTVFHRASASRRCIRRVLTAIGVSDVKSSEQGDSADRDVL